MYKTCEFNDSNEHTGKRINSIEIINKFDETI